MGPVRFIAARLRRFHKWNCPFLNRKERDTAWLGMYGELDLVCRDGNCLVFVEVKTRTGNGYGGARRAVDARKRALIRRGAAEWLRQLPEPVPSRYDIVEVLYREGKPPEFRRIRGAFGEKDLDAS